MTAALVIPAWIGLGLALPALVTMRSPGFPPHDGTASAAPGGTVTISSPVILSYGSRLWLKRGTLSLVVPAAKAASDATLPPNGTARLMLEDAVLYLGAARLQGSDSAQDVFAPLVEALAGLKFESLTLKRVTMTLVLADGHSETLYDIKAGLVRSRKGALTAKGEFTLRGQRLSFDLSTGLRAETREPAPLPLKLSIRASGFGFSIDGHLNAAAGVKIDGQSEIAIADLRHAARWLGAPWPSGPGLQDIKIKGQLAWTGRTLAFDKAAFETDRNPAAGALIVDMTGPRPKLNGTLAFKTLDLNPYLRAEAEQSLALWSWATFSGSDSAVPLARQIDADVRISAERMKAGSLTFGASAATLTLNNGILFADIAEIEWHEGHGGGQVVLNTLGPKVRTSVRGKLEDMDFAGASLGLFGRNLLQGRGAVAADLSATGLTMPDLLRSLSGKVALAMADGGRVGLDVKRLLDAARIRDLDGWGRALNDQTAVDTLDLRLQIKSGVAVCEQIEGVSADIRFLATGAIHLADGRLDFRIVGTTAAGTENKTEQILVRGPWAAPSVRRESVPSQEAVPLDGADPPISRDQRTWLQRG
ncbi:MAG: AsmA family protein [Hyphomicrobiaceae bacterium]